MRQNQPFEKRGRFNIAVWKQTLAKKYQGRERQRLMVIDDVWKAIERLNGQYRWEALYLFGSVTHPGKFSQRSDIDVGIQGLNKLQHYRFVADLSGLLEREVDVVRFEDCSFSETIKTMGVQWKKPE